MSEEIKWTPDGRRCEVVQKLESGEILVRIGMYDEVCDDYWYDKLSVVPRVFDRAPTEHLDDRVTELNDLINDHRATLRDLDSKIHDADQREKDLVDTVQRVKALEKIDAYLKGKITHYVIEGFGKVKILTVQETLESRDWHKVGRILALQPASDCSGGKLTWKLSDYCDGSGVWRACVPCTSADEAEGVAKSIVRSGMEKNPERWVEAARALDLPVPKEIEEKLKNREISDLTEKLRQALSQVAEYRKLIAKVRGDQE